MKTVRSCLEDIRADLKSVDRVSGPRSLDPVWTLDETVPASLAGRWSAADTDAILARDFARSMMNAGGSVLLLMSVMAVALGFGDPVVCAAFAALALLALIAGGRSHRRSRRPGAFTAGEIDVILEHRHEVSFDDWDVFIEADAPPEVTAARRAKELADNLLTLPSWSSEHLAEQRLRFDPAGEARQIRLAARELYDLRRVLEAENARVQGSSTRALDLVRSDWDHHLHISWVALSDRLAAFEDYARDVEVVAAIIDKNDVADHLNAALEAHGPKMSISAVGHEMAASDLHLLRDDLLTLKLGLQSTATDFEVEPGRPDNGAIAGISPPVVRP